MNIGRPRKIDYNEVLDKINSGMTAKEIANDLNISSASVHKIAKLNNIEVKLPPKKFPPQIDDIIARVLETENGHLVDREFGLSRGASKKYCKKMGIDYKKRIGKPKDKRSFHEKLKDYPIWKEVLDLYSSGIKPVEIQKKLNLPAGSACKILNYFDIHIGKGNNTGRWKVPESVIDLYQSGLGCKEISKLIGIPDEVVRKKLVQWNIPRRIGKASGSKNPQWKGGKERIVHKYRRQCYEVAAICLKRPVPNGYVIHHLDENPKNNHPKNLMIFPSSKLHAKFHQTVIKNHVEVGSKEAIHLALEIGGTLLPEPDFPIQF